MEAKVQSMRAGKGASQVAQSGRAAIQHEHEPPALIRYMASVGLGPPLHSTSSVVSGGFRPAGQLDRRSSERT
jgi:hypothetical protein